MNYPTSMQQVVQADRMQLAKWQRFLPSPGQNAIGEKNFQEVMKKEADILDVICTRFLSKGGMTPEISKALGWKEV